MLRQRENPESFRAGVFSVLVHVLLLGALLISFNWKTTHPISIAEVELWESIPSPENTATVTPPDIQPPHPEKEVQKPQPVIEPKIEPKPQVDIAMEKKPAKEKPVKKEPLKPLAKTNDANAKKIAEAMRLEDLKNTTKPNNDALKKLQQESLNEDKAAGEQKNASAKASASASVTGEYIDKIRAKIRGNVNKTLCGNGNPELKFEIGLMPTGELSAAPKLVKSSGNAACDSAVERAIMMSEPLPLPADSTQFAKLRNLELKFRPNDN